SPFLARSDRSGMERAGPTTTNKAGRAARLRDLSRPRRCRLRAMLVRRAAPLVAIALACASASCAALLGFWRLSEEPGDVGGDDASDASPSDGSGASDPCHDLGIPPAPLDAGTGIAPAILGALRVLDFGIDVDGGRPKIPGINLDLTCSFDV